MIITLKLICFSQTQLSRLPSSVCTLTQLQCLVANNNKLVSLPEEIWKMKNLIELDVTYNKIHIPAQIED